MQLRDLLLVINRGDIEIDYSEIFTDMDEVTRSMTCSCNSRYVDLPIGMWESYIEGISIAYDSAIVKTSCCKYNGHYYQDSHDAEIAMINDKYE